MGEYLRVGRLSVTADMVHCLADVTLKDEPMAKAMLAIMSVIAPIDVKYDPAHARYHYVAYSPLFDDVLLSEGEEPPEYVLEAVSNDAGQTIVTSARRA